MKREKVRTLFNATARFANKTMRRAWLYTKHHPLRALLRVSLASGAAAIATTSLMTRPLYSYLADNNAPQLAPYFTDQHTRVFYRYRLFGKANDAESFWLGSDTRADMRLCFVYPPPRNASLADFIKSYTDFEAETYTFPKQDLLAQAYFTRIMAHEKRHCDQVGGTKDTILLYESDADIYALRVVREIYGKDIAQEITSITTNVRVISGVVKDGYSHATARAIKGYGLTTFRSAQDQASYHLLHRLLRITDELNTEAFESEEYTKNERYYHVANALLKDPRFDDKDLRQIATAFVEAIDYFDRHTSEQLIKPLPAGVRINVDDVMSYTPAPGPLIPKKSLSLQHKPSV